MPETERVWNATRTLVQNANKVCRQPGHDDYLVVRCSAEPLVRRRGLEGVRQGRVVRTTSMPAKATGVESTSVDLFDRPDGGRRVSQIEQLSLRVTLSWGSRAETRFGNGFNSFGIIGIGTPASREISGVRPRCKDDGVHLLRSERCLGLQNMLAPMLMRRASTVVLNR